MGRDETANPAAVEPTDADMTKARPRGRAFRVSDEGQSEKRAAQGTELLHAVVLPDSKPSVKIPASQPRGVV